MNELKGYQHRRLDLADMIRAMLHILRGYADAEREQEARQLLERLAADRFQLAVAGQFSRGKTTLLNALLGAAYLPMGALPMTSVVTTVRYGSRPRATVRRRGSPLPVEAPLAEVARFVAQASAERAELQVSSVEVEVPAEILRLGFEFADTPGIGSAIEVNTAATARFLPQADAVIVVTGFDSPLTQAETDFLTRVGEHAGKLFVVINKRDLIAERDAAEVTGYVRQWLRDHLHRGEPQVFGLSALEALEGSIQGDHERMAASGVLALRGALADFFTTGKARTYLHNVAARAADLAAGQRRDLRLGCLAADGAAGPDAVAAAFDTRMEELSAAEHALAEQIATRVRDGLPGLLAERGPAWQASLEDLVASPAADASVGDADPARGQLEDAVAVLERADRDITHDWLDRRTAEVRELLIGLTAADIGALLEHARSPRAIGAQIAGLAAADERGGLAGWSPEDVPDLAAPRLQWLVTVPQRRPRRRRPGAGEARLLTDALQPVASEFVERAREAFEAAARDWAARLGGQAARQTAEAADQVRVYLRTAPREEDLAALDDLATRLARFRASLDAWNPAAGAMPAQAGAAVLPAQPVGCPVCSQMEATLTEHLRRDQFLLATRERDQARHARAGGFCPMHTWQYAGMASPIGIAAGYARLAATMAAALDDITHHSANEIADSVTGLIRASTCPVCTALARSEASEVARIASQAPTAGSATPLCLRHLALVLTTHPAPSSSQAMIHALAEALRRASEDMREYALKREARHSALATDEESRAHSDVLRLLAGQPALARPWDSDIQAGSWGKAPGK
jgi:Dynamin family